MLAEGTAGGRTLSLPRSDTTAIPGHVLRAAADQMECHVLVRVPSPPRRATWMFGGDVSSAAGYDAAIRSL
eukprot:3464909-Pyramimonas_sp.AAC.1